MYEYQFTRGNLLKLSYLLNIVRLKILYTDTRYFKIACFSSQFSQLKKLVLLSR